ncbi:PadR family transcriptional regulator [Rhodococcus sp. NPDC004095]
MENIQDLNRHDISGRGRRGRPGRTGREHGRLDGGPEAGGHGRRGERGGGHGRGGDFGPHGGHGPRCDRGTRGEFPLGRRGGRGQENERVGRGRGRGRGGRGRRGDVRTAVLVLLAEGEMHGYELIQQIAERSNGVWKPSPGSIYPALAQLEDEGLVLIEKVAGRKNARLTEAGTTYVTEHRDELGTPWDEVRADVGRPAQELRGLMHQLTGAVRQAAFAGTTEQAQATADVLTEARRAIYRILADDTAATGGPTAE